MSEVELRIKVNGHEVEVKGSREDVIELLEKTMEYVSQFRSWTAPSMRETPPGMGEVKGEERVLGEELADLPPPIGISPKDSTATILQKLFSSPWASRPRALKEVLGALSSLGLHYPKSTVAVNLTRLVKRNIIRRMKSKENVYLYIPTIPPRARELEQES
ncbi:MAG: BlaI/MecI/CopY family transcriptional regulator [Candidatus Geothermarchaeales archaeon]